MHRPLLIVALSLVATPAYAQQVKIAFNEGQVSVETTRASTRAILAEWSKVGGTNIVNGDRVGGAPLTLKLIGVPEAQALEIILKSVAGYMAAPRGSAPGASMYDRILVMPTSSVVPTASVRPPGPTFPGATAGTQRFIPPRQVPPQDEATEADEPGEPSPSEPVFAFPQPAGPNGFRGYTAPPAPGSAPSPDMQAAPTGPVGFGVVGAPAPGMIQLPPQQPAAPGRPPVRPPGQ